MPALEIPKGKSLYDILQIEKETANENSIKKAYRKLALKYHPDKQATDATQQEKENATYEFQLIGLAYSILGDKNKKKNYDHTGSLEEETWLTEDKDWNDYFKSLWTGVVNEQTIADHLASYKGSNEEKEDVLKTYTLVHGNMDKLLDHVMHSEVEDVPRFIQIIQTAMKEKKVKDYPQFAKTTTASAQLRREKKAAKEKLLAEEEKKKIEEKKEQSKKKDHTSNDTNVSEDSLQALILARQKQRWASTYGEIDGMEEELAASFDRKYGSKKSSKKNTSTKSVKPTKNKTKEDNNNGDDDLSNSKNENPKKNKRKHELSTDSNEASTSKRPTKTQKKK